MIMSKLCTGISMLWYDIEHYGSNSLQHNETTVTFPLYCNFDVT